MVNCDKRKLALPRTTRRSHRILRTKLGKLVVLRQARILCAINIGPFKFLAPSGCLDDRDSGGCSSKKHPNTQTQTYLAKGERYKDVHVPRHTGQMKLSSQITVGRKHFTLFPSDVDLSGFVLHFQLQLIALHREYTALVAKVMLADMPSFKPTPPAEFHHHQSTEAQSR